MGFQPEQTPHDWLGVVLRDLKNPLTSILANTRYIATEGASRKDSAEALDDILVSAESMQRMLANLQDLYQSQKQPLALTIEPVDAESLLMDVRRSFLRVLYHHPRPLRIRRDPRIKTVFIDRHYFQRVLEQLVDSGLHERSNYEPIELVVFPDDAQPDLVCFKITLPGLHIQRAQFTQASKMPFSLHNLNITQNYKAAFEQALWLGISFCALVIGAHHGRFLLDDSNPQCLSMMVKIKAGGQS